MRMKAYIEISIYMKRNYTSVVITVIFFIAVLCLFVFTFGQIDIIEKKDKLHTEGKSDKINRLQNRYQKLKILIERKEELNNKLKKKFKRIYFGVRVLLIVLYIGYSVVLYYIFNITKLGDLLNWNQLALLVISVFSFIAFGTITNAIEFITKVKMWIESKVYSKHIDIENELDRHKREDVFLATTISEKQLLISNNQTNNKDENDTENN